MKDLIKKKATIKLAIASMYIISAIILICLYLTGINNAVIVGGFGVVIIQISLIGYLLGELKEINFYIRLEKMGV
jgi:hypothetical protein